MCFLQHFISFFHSAMQAMNLNENQMKLPPNNYQGHGYSRSASIGATSTYNRPNAPFGTSPHAMHNSVAPSNTPPIIPQGQMQMPVTVPKPQPLQPPAYASPHHSIVHATSMPDLQQPKTENVPPQILNEPSLQKPPIGGNLSYPVFSSSPLKPPSTVGEPSTGPSKQPNSHVGQPLFYFSSNESHPAVANVVTTATSCLRSMPEIGLLDRPAPTQAKMEECQSTKLNKTMPSLSADVPGTAHHVRSTSMPNFQDIRDAGIQGQGVMPPPVDGYYTRRVSSACSSRQRTPSPARDMNSRTETEELSDENKDTEVLQKTLANLNFTLDQLSSVSDVKLIDDIKKRIDIFTQCWTEGKLSPKVKSNMSCLSIGKEYLHSVLY